jgi:hypothetical protein
LSNTEIVEEFIEVKSISGNSEVPERIEENFLVEDIFQSEENFQVEDNFIDVASPLPCDDLISEKIDPQPEPLAKPHEIFIHPFKKVSKRPKNVQRIKIKAGNSIMSNTYPLIVDEVIVKVDRSDKPVEVDPIDEKVEKPKTQKHVMHINKYKCLKSNCELLFFTKVERFHHMRVENHIPAPTIQDRQFFCYCGETFETKKQENDHIRENHNVKMKCNLCGYLAFTLFGIQRHVTQDHGEGHFTVTLLTKLKGENESDVYR